MSERVEKVSSADGTEIACWVGGSGPALVMVHGTTGDHGSQAMVTPLLTAAGFTVWSLDRRGRGESSDSPSYTIEREFEDVAAVVDSVAEPVNLYGHSFGADIALGASLLTSNLAKMILYEPSAGVQSPTEEQLGQLDALLANGNREELFEAMLRGVSGLSEEQIAIFKATPFWEKRLAAVHTTPRELRAQSEHRIDPEGFARMQTPTLLLLGSESPEWARAGAQLVDSALPNVRLEILEGQGHSANMTAPDLLAGAITRFLTQ